VKNSVTGLFCLCLLWAGWTRSGQAQTPSPGPKPDPAAASAPQDQQTPTGGPIIQAPPELPKYPDVRLPGEHGFWIGLGASQPKGQSIYDTGRANASQANSGFVTMQGTPHIGESVEGGIVLGLHNALRVSYFQTSASGDFLAPTDMTMWSQNYSSGDLVSTNYKLQDIKVSFDYLTWPYPVGYKRFRLKTLWQVQYVVLKSTFNAPQLPLVNSSGAPLTDASGNPITYVGQGTSWFITPTLGLGFQEYISHHLRLELNGVGFGIPHHSTLWDVDGSINIRVGRFEIGAGARAFHFKTSPEGSYYMRGTLTAPQVSLRWFSE